MAIPQNAFPVSRADIHHLRDFLVNQRRVNGWTQEELSERSGVSVRTIRNLETGANTNPRRSSISLLLAAFGDTAAGRPDMALWSGGWPRMPEPAWEPPRPAATGTAGAAPPWRGPRPPYDPLVGRQSDMRHVLAAAQRSRLVVLTGPGGVGKTRLALAVAARLRPLFRDGVGIAELHDCPPEHLAPDAARAAVARTVRQQLTPDGSATPVSERGPRLLVLDSAEHLVRETSRIARQLLDEHPGLHLLITSRRALAVGAAETWDVGPLRVDRPEDGDVSVPSAVELFLRRAQSSLPALDLGADLGPITTLCRMVDGVPLAIEIAAQCLRSLPLASLLRQDTLFHLLGRIDAGDLSRHRTLWGNVRWSYDLLPDAHRELLRELAVLPDVFTLEDALQARPPGGFEATRVAHLLAELADASLVQVERGQQYRYRVHALLRHFVCEAGCDPRDGMLRDTPSTSRRPAVVGSF